MAMLLQKGENCPMLPNPESVIKEPTPNTLEPQEAVKKKHILPEHIITIKDGEATLYKCVICDKTFKTKSNCCYHKHCAAGTEKPYTCTLCNRKFSSKAHFTYHNLMHSGVNPHKCDQCDKSFKTKSKLFRHQEIHSEKRKLFYCDVCDRSFLRKTSIKVHKRTHTCDKPFCCSMCPKTFSEKKKLINHITSHTGAKDWICEVCGKAYSIKWNLELHKRTHSRVRPYYCNECKQSFSQKRYLKRHLETHKSSIKYICGLCDKEFSRKDNLQRHIVNTHLEYQNGVNFASLDEIKLQRDESGVVSQIANKSGPKPPANEKPAIRTESVIKSLTKTYEIIDFNYDDIEKLSNKISVIKKVDKVGVSDGTLSLSNELNMGNEPSVASDTRVNPVFVEVIKENLSRFPGGEENDQPGSVPNIAENGDFVKEGSNGHFSREHSTDTREFVRSPRCMLPKKVITASFKEFSVLHDSDRDNYTLSQLGTQ